MGLEGLPRDRLLVLTGKRGRAYGADFFRHEFRRWASAASAKGAQTGLTFHGLRKTATVKLLEAGSRQSEVMAITGHRTDTMVRLYGRDASKRKLAGRARDRAVADEEQKQAKLIIARTGTDNSGRR